MQFLESNCVFKKTYGGHGVQPRGQAEVGHGAACVSPLAAGFESAVAVCLLKTTEHLKKYRSQEIYSRYQWWKRTFMWVFFFVLFTSSTCRTGTDKLLFIWCKSEKINAMRNKRPDYRYAMIQKVWSVLDREVYPHPHFYSSDDLCFSPLGRKYEAF